MRYPCSPPATCNSPSYLGLPEPSGNDEANGGERLFPSMPYLPLRVPARPLRRTDSAITCLSYYLLCRASLEARGRSFTGLWPTGASSGDPASECSIDASVKSLNQH
jgi:hypothetical protein